LVWTRRVYLLVLKRQIGRVQSEERLVDAGSGEVHHGRVSALKNGEGAGARCGRGWVEGDIDGAFAASSQTGTAGVRFGVVARRGRDAGDGHGVAAHIAQGSDLC